MGGHLTVGDHIQSLQQHGYSLKLDAPADGACTLWVYDSDGAVVGRGEHEDFVIAVRRAYEWVINGVCEEDE